MTVSIVSMVRNDSKGKMMLYPGDYYLALNIERGRERDAVEDVTMTMFRDTCALDVVIPHKLRAYCPCPVRDGSSFNMSSEYNSPSLTHYWQGKESQAMREMVHLDW